MIQPFAKSSRHPDSEKTAAARRFIARLGYCGKCALLGSGFVATAEMLGDNSSAFA
jgi:hypothetical protein